MGSQARRAAEQAVQRDRDHEEPAGVVAARMSRYHTAHLTPDPSRRLVWEAVARHLAPYVPAEAAVLEIGAGYCDWINQVRAARRVAVDVWPEMPTFAAPGVEPVVLDVAAGLHSLGAASFDVVLASNLLEHFSPDRKSTRLNSSHIQKSRMPSSA